MEIIVEYWLSLGAGIFLLLMVLYGHYRGFLRIAVAMSALIISIAVVQIATPHITSFLKNHTEIQRLAEQGLMTAAGLGAETMNEGEELHPSHQRLMIEEMHLPQQMKDALMENNNNEIYHRLGVETFLGYVGAYLADIGVKSCWSRCSVCGSIFVAAVVGTMAGSGGEAADSFWYQSNRRRNSRWNPRIVVAMGGISDYRSVCLSALGNGRTGPNPKKHLADLFISE